MRVASTVRYIFRLPYLTKRPERSIWKGKGIDDSPSIEVTVHCHDDDSQSTGSEMAVNASELDLHHGGSSSSSSSSSSRSRLVRVVSWASIVCDRCRWTAEQERDLAIARSELGRCQKAWSSEQELWLSYIEALTEEKEAHEEFLVHRAKQQDDEQQHFRKAWNRRRSSEEQPVDANAHRASSRVRRLRKRHTGDFY
ncbi:hypothetical protein BDV32DRAFT_150686 [Aspergillus pseudonomiae]|uniref:Uncharacterized protein n=1 Tax=Aspergillus pseudonomiae TaxID=1506151 RepID=A0A5N7DEA3_9EURO|nr:uncharacterized protein BDV37DRAFT_282532 [Aspergillus pseudonomiae]KAB8259158.1 hypothetical protein BDV32DRAFT_150686 [Aspergillus pseudonomiae]KAE8404732.1 hypothetical protein BDV37DRAFT_282532 [Aspergillus pseudonomiae]